MNSSHSSAVLKTLKSTSEYFLLSYNGLFWTFVEPYATALGKYHTQNGMKKQGLSSVPPAQRVDSSSLSETVVFLHRYPALLPLQNNAPHADDVVTVHTHLGPAGNQLFRF